MDLVSVFWEGIAPQTGKRRHAWQHLREESSFSSIHITLDTPTNVERSSQQHEKGPETMDRIIRRPMSRRNLVGGLTVGGTAAMLATWPGLAHRAAAAERNAAFRLQSTPTTDVPDGPFTLEPLSYDYAALEPHIDALTMQIHHGKHHQAYVDNLNKAIADLPEFQAMTALELIGNLDQVPEDRRTAIRNNAGGHVNHSLFWELMTPGGVREPSGALADAIASDFGDLAALQEEVTTAGLGRFGSGWAWVLINEDGTLAVTSTPNQDNPVMEGGSSPILGVDVWEHAYYLKYQNKRKDYLTAWWNTVNWDIVNVRYEQVAAG